MSNIGLEYKVDETLKLRAKEILDASGCTSGLDWFMKIFQEEPEAVAKKIYKSDILRQDIPVLCFQIRGEDDYWTQQLCDELETLYCEEEGK
ncbi:hypothetical protein emhyr_43 [Salmonella phage emhyr]|uniref:Uncharacterized protein n=11 Tax=Rosemountvirus TaxID=2733127 RepID=A0A6G8RD07_9CAUD|nr:hypothetical protein [Escherichia coli]YP_009845561.1 hypothetical protein HWC19_gp54 [Salmonella phage SE13]YP_009857633.1 hypothetical protein HWD19_gp42 [Salmonella phage yarpen]EBY3944463.1 hypothetical protein [Salmonella enterica subsp. enterica serovar Kottbus]EEJ2154926.1 hypothetical protein [Salmonella enterica subsp. enterica]QIN98263.1 hypothetical protein emiel_40 [Salmonella phage emiel]QIN98334.1 hypothetical protein brorfarstad_43 [Salmonella phage brorfarstad]QIN98475.1 h